MRANAAADRHQQTIEQASFFKRRDRNGLLVTIILAERDRCVSVGKTDISPFAGRFTAKRPVRCERRN
ncbi:MAG TPA: hypothetical protein PKA82_17025 [Pyrinomonadaceae bacterium]|nr:hypothetical protein [Pyrinomonadaceae bacterium]